MVLEVYVGEHVALKLLELGEEGVVAVAGPLGKGELVARRADALEELRDREVFVQHRPELPGDRRWIGLLRHECGEQQLLLFIEMRQERRGDFLDGGLEVTELRVVIAVHAAHLRGQGLDEREGLAEVLVVLRHDVSHEPRRGELAGVVLPFAAPLGDRAGQFGKESVHIDLLGQSSRLDALISLATEVDAMALEDLGAFRVVEDDTGDRLLAIEGWIFHMRVFCTFRATAGRPA